MSSVMDNTIVHGIIDRGSTPLSYLGGENGLLCRMWF